jgi:hypothetical protein
MTVLSPKVKDEVKQGDQGSDDVEPDYERPDVVKAGEVYQQAFGGQSRSLHMVPSRRAVTRHRGPKKAIRGRHTTRRLYIIMRASLVCVGELRRLLSIDTGENGRACFLRHL